VLKIRHLCVQQHKDIGTSFSAQNNSVFSILPYDLKTNACLVVCVTIFGYKYYEITRITLTKDTSL
jgi:hypothetical protein